MTVIRHTFKARGHWWFDSGLMGLYFIARELLQEEERWPGVEVVLDFDGVSIEALDDRLAPFLESCYNELAASWWNRSTKKQQESLELVCYDREEKKLCCRPKRMPTPIPALSVSATSWRGEADAFEDLPVSLQEEVTAYLKEQKKSLWGTKKKLCYEQPVCHPQLDLFPKPKRGGGAVCSVCGQTSVCDRVSQTSFPLFSSQSATYSFNSDLGSPDLICWECQLLGKFAVHAAYYKVADSLTYIMQLSSGDLRVLEDAHRTFGIPSALRLSLNDDKIYFYNFGEQSRILQNARLSYEVLWGFYLAAYELVLRNQQQRRSDERALEAPDEVDEMDEESLRQTAALNVILAALDSKGSTFITKEVVTYTDTAYLFRLIGFIKKYIRTEAPEAMGQELGRFFEFLFWDLELPNLHSQKPYDPLKGMDRNSLLRCVFEKKSIVCRVESFVFKKSLAEDYPWLGRILFFVMAYELVAHCRDSEEGEEKGMAKGMTKEQIALATKLGSQIVLAAKEALEKKGEKFDPIKGDLFTLRKTRTAVDFLEQLNRLQFRYGIVVNKDIAAGIFAELAEEHVPFEEFRAYCMIAALNVYNSIMRPRGSGNDPSDSHSQE